MSEQEQALAETARTVNCCNGRVGRRLVELAAIDDRVRTFVQPTGVELVRSAIEAGLRGDTVNCCNGRVGRQAFEELVTSLGGQ
jgi:hypothetical protein